MQQQYQWRQHLGVGGGRESGRGRDVVGEGILRGCVRGYIERVRVKGTSERMC